MPISVKGISHVRLTVTDIERSRTFYDQVFGFEVADEIPDDADDRLREKLGYLYGGVIYQVPGGLFGLRPVAKDGDQFDEDRTGLDHLSFAAASRGDLEAAAATLDQLGIRHEPIKDIGNAFLLEFRDPDNIALELLAPKTG